MTSISVKRKYWRAREASRWRAPAVTSTLGQWSHIIQDIVAHVFSQCFFLLWEKIHTRSRSVKLLLTPSIDSGALASCAPIGVALHHISRWLSCSEFIPNCKAHYDPRFFSEITKILWKCRRIWDCKNWCWAQIMMNCNRIRPAELIGAEKTDDNEKSLPRLRP